MLFFFFFFNDTATTEIYTLSLHDALPICLGENRRGRRAVTGDVGGLGGDFLQHLCAHVLVGVLELDLKDPYEDRKSTRLNSSHVRISYAVFCLKKKKIMFGMSKYTADYNT